MTPFRRRLLAQKHGSSEPIFYQTSLIEADVTASTQAGERLSWVSGQKYHFVFDWEVTAVNDSSTGIRIRSQAQETTFVQESNVTVGQTGHVDVTYTGNSTRQRMIFVLQTPDSKPYSIEITNLTIYLAS